MYFLFRLLAVSDLLSFYSMNSKQLLLAGLLLSASATTYAQRPAAADSLARSLAVATLSTAAAEDTVQALNLLYARRRMGGISWMLGGTLGGVRTLTAASQPTTINTSYGPMTIDDGASAGGLLAGAGVMLLVDGYGLSKLVRFSRGKQMALTAAVRAGQPLPPDVRRRLKSRFFTQPIVPYKAVTYKSAP